MEVKKDEEDQLIWKSEEAATESMLSVTVGRVITTLLTARPRKLHDVVSRFSQDPKRTTSSLLASLEDSLCFLHKYVNDAAEDKEAFDQILVPIIEHSWKNGRQAMILVNWLFQDDLLFRALATNLANIIIRKDDRYIALGWCILVRNLLEYETSITQYSMNGIRERYHDVLKILSSCMSRLLSIDGFELPSRLSVSAADCMLALAEALAKKVSSNKPTSTSNGSSWLVTLVPASSTGDKKVKPASKSSEVSNLEMGYLFWDRLEELIHLVQRLLAWSRKSRTLHAKGLEKVLKWLQEIKGNYGCFQDEADSKKFESTIEEYGMQISRVLLPQLHCTDEDVIDGVVCIFKAVIFRPSYSSGSSVTDTRLMDSVLQLLLQLLDERDGTARAVVKLIAEYCSVSRDSQCIQEVLKRIASGNVLQRRNAVDVISELICISSDSINELSHLAWQDVANQLLECLGDEESVIREQASSLLPMIGWL
uniref:Uncharacterized protein n=1 Tax=Fagus sylvatica TaxID=28930 RepID=A0A2N9IX14_FAGSY